MSKRLLREWVKVVVSEQASMTSASPPTGTGTIVVDHNKAIADEVASKLTSQYSSKFRPGRRDNRVNRVYPVDPSTVTTEDLLAAIEDIYDPTFNKTIPPNSSFSNFSNDSGKFPAIVFIPSPAKKPASLDPDTAIPIMLARGGNVGEAYESDLVSGLKQVAAGGIPSANIKKMLIDIGTSAEGILGADVKQTSPKSRKLTGSPYDVGKVIADIIITPLQGAALYLSVKNVAGSTFGNHGYAGGFKIIPRGKQVRVISGSGPGNTEDFIKALGINKARAARGYTNYINKKSSSPGQKIVSPRAIDRDVIRNWLASGVGFGYYYVREQGDGSIKVIPIMNAEAALSFVGDVKSVALRYPQGPDISKQITAKISTTSGMFTAEVRNSSGKVMPNEIKLKINKFYVKESLEESRNALSIRENKMKLTEKILRRMIRESLLSEELTKTDKKEIEKIARKQAQKEIDKVVGKSLEKTISDEVQKILKKKATKDELADITKSVMKKLYKDLSTSYPQVIDRIKV